MSMDNVDLIVFIAVAIGLLCLLFGFCEESKSKSFRAALMALGLIIMLPFLQQRFFCIQTTPMNEKVVSESHPIAEDGVMLESSVSGFIGVRSDTNYVVLAEQEDGSIRTLTLNASSVSVYEDAPSWEDAHVDKVLEATASVEGTFFGVPVKDTQLSGNLFPEYHIHVPEGALR